MALVKYRDIQIFLIRTLLFASVLIKDVVIARRSRIIGGVNTIIQVYPYQASLRSIQWGRQPWHFCGGSIITKNHVITAAHCFNGPTSLQDRIPYTKVYTGTSRSDYGQYIYNIRKITLHPQFTGAYVAYQTTYEYDIAIVTLAESIQFNAFQQPIRLPRADVLVNKVGVITGWGSTDHLRGNQPVNLQVASMNILPSYHCRSLLPVVGLKDSQVCAIHSRGVGMCSGDSGGPLAVNGELIGVASFVEDCGIGKPDVYTKVYYYINFIRQVINS